MRFFRQIVLPAVICSAFIVSCSIATHEEAVESIKTGEQKDALVRDQWAASAGTGLVDDGWLKSFNDPVLMELVDEAQNNNFGLKIASAQVEQAVALAASAGAALKPTVGLSGGYSDNTAGNSDGVYGAGLSIAWEADVWGRVRSGVAGAEETVAATRSDLEFAKQSLAANTASGWFIAGGSKILGDYSQEVVSLLTETLRIAEVKEKVGQGAMQDVHLARASLAESQEAARQAQTALENAKRSLELLLGRYPGAEIQTADTLVAVPPPIAPGIPSELLERRPDLIAAEQRVAAAFYKQREAELMKLPRFSFSLGAGLTNLTDAVAGLAAGIFAPLYTGGAIEAEIAGATAEQKKAIASYGQAALQAFKEVETALAAEDHLLQRESFLKEAVDENFKAFQLVQKQYEVGKIEFIDVLTVQNKWIQSKIALIDVSTRRLVNRVQLHLALGGSFAEEEQPAG